MIAVLWLIADWSDVMFGAKKRWATIDQSELQFRFIVLSRPTTKLSGRRPEDMEYERRLLRRSTSTPCSASFVSTVTYANTWNINA